MTVYCVRQWLTAPVTNWLCIVCVSAVDDFNNAVVLTSRPLRPREMFEIQLDRMVDKWAGSIEIGVTSHSPLDIEFPATMTNIRSGTWMMTGNGVMHNGRMIQEDYGHNLDALKVEWVH